MSLSQTDFEVILGDASKRINDDIVWVEDEDHSPAREFRAPVESDSGWPLFIRGTYNPLLPSLTYAMILKSVGRVYALDLGKNHRNPDWSLVGLKHKHRWTEEHKDQEAYVPTDITAKADEPLRVWEQFCLEANMTHAGVMKPPPPYQDELFP